MKIKVKKGAWSVSEYRSIYYFRVSDYCKNLWVRNGKLYSEEGDCFDTLKEAKTYIEDQYEKYVLSLIEVEDEQNSAEMDSRNG